MRKWVTKIKRNCLICEKKFLPHSNSQKICDNCKRKKCIFCGKIFSSYRKSKFCSRECYLKFRWKGVGGCKFCGKPTKYLFCSKKCFWKNEYYTKRKRKFWEKKIALIKELGGKCIKCGITDIRVLDINHKDKTKKERPPKLQYTWQRRLKEWEKNKKYLELLCANCHRKITWEQMKWGNY